MEFSVETKGMVNLKVNLDFLPLKGQYFLWNAGTAPVVPFLPIYARQLGFSSTIVGMIYTVLPITGMLAKPVFGAIADHYRLQKTLFLAFQIITAISFFVIQYIPEIQTETTSSQAMLDCDALTYFKICSNDTNNCAAARLMAETSNNGTILCELECAADAGFTKEVCEVWNVSQYCNLMNDINLLQFDAEVPLSHTLQTSSETGSCLHFRVHRAFIGSSFHVPYCRNLTTTPCRVQCRDPAVNEVFREPAVNDVNVADFYQFWLFFLLMVFSWVSMAVVVCVGDAICFEMLGDQSSRYGHQRLWGAVGWGIFAIISGFLVDELSKGRAQKDYTVVFYLMLFMLILDVIVSSRLKHSQTKLSTSIVRDVGKLLTEIRIVIFMLWCVAVGLSTGLQWNFLFWHLEDLATTEGCDMLHWMKTIEGLVMGVQCFGGELPFLFLSGRILRKIGHVHAMSLVLFAFGIRFIIYSILKNPWWCLPVELFQGFTFGLFYATMTSYASVVAPPGTEATVQGTVGAVFEGVGVSVGSLLGGILYDKFDGATTFQIYGIVSLGLFVVHFLVQIIIGRKREGSEQARDSGSSARYAAPNEALDMMDDMQELTPS
ncbi:major facilitator superfamily domain-containing protein 6-A isoform X2 [Zootermopsis nevadensis]|uniref:major facilitator superfamily domain-containing protein 6-A isoform X2 n=1 Tax=Zootermopsis nevadensis TaxID=136037 RepID=UPI000B8EDDDB|nr:major facilitator superfamily domain-containing protein 6-A isoform X2 [Zootermopsis nevadensis]